MRYFEGDTIYKGKRCAYNEGDIPYLEKIVCNFFSVDCIEQNKTLIDEKITVLLNAIINSKDSSLHIDLRNFFEFNNCFAFVFNTDNDETITPYIYYLCSTRATSLRKLPVSTIKNQRNNYVAIFNKNTITDNDLRLLCYICLQKGSHSSFERINSIVSTNPISRNELSVLFTESREDFCTEYFYRILFDSSNILQSFTDRNILTEIMARVDGMYGWPHCYELSTQLEMMIVEMYNKGIIKVRYHSEIDLFNLVKEKYNDALFQYKDMWLENQSLDIYIPQWKIAIEYQGQQHYTSVKHFGGKNALAASRKRDKTKKELCTQNGVSLIEWKYDMAITKENVDKMLPYKSTL